MYFDCTWVMLKYRPQTMYRVNVSTFVIIVIEYRFDVIIMIINYNTYLTKNDKYFILVSCGRKIFRA